MDNTHRQFAGMFADDRLRWLAALLADEPAFDRRTLWRLGSWAACTVGALVTALLTVHWSQDVRREQLAAADLARQSQQLQSAARDAVNENRRLASAVSTLNGDRDRLYARVTVLEQGLDSLTGTVTRQNAPPPSLFLLSATQPVTLPPPVIGAPATTARVAETAAPAEPDATPAAPPPHPAPPTHTAPAETPRAPLPSATVYAPPDPAASRMVEAPAPAAPDRRVATADRLAARSDVVADGKPPPATQAVPTANPPISQVPNPPTAAQDPPATTATIAPAGQPAPEVPAARTDFGVDLGGANSVEGLRALWQGLLKTDAALLSPLRPIIAIRERSNGLGMQLRLVAGPLADAAAAAKICAALAQNSRICETTVFDGQRLALRSEPNPASRVAPVARPLPSRKHVTPRPANREEPEPPASAPAPAPAPAASSSSLLPEFLRSR